jgi:hypothetical protein
MSRRSLLATVLVLALIAAGCGGDDDSTGDTSASTTRAATTAAPGDTTPTTTAAAPSSGGGNGQLVLGDETIAFDSTRCFLEAQDAAGGGGKILFVAQGFGTNAAGDDVTVDISRYDEDSQFTGDDVLIDFADVSLQSRTDIGTISVDGRTLSADGLSFRNMSDFSEIAGSFEINC